MKHLFLFLYLLSSSFLFAQHYEVGQEYNFSSEGITYTVSYDEDGRAHVSRSQNENTEESKAYIFTDRDYWTNIAADDNIVEMEATEDAPVDNFWIISFDPTNEEVQAVQVGGPKPSVTFSCLCKGNSKGSCSPSYVIVRNTATVNCVPEAGCMRCKLVDKKVKGIEYPHTFLILEAEEIIFE